MPYLEPYYEGYGGPRSVRFQGRPLLGLIGRVLRGRGPPAPFSRGPAHNLSVFFLARKPFPHAPARAPQALAQP